MISDHLKYRPDIDGLRAIAVSSVILFHIDESLLPGGFLGVDIFFVISGYLITLLLIKESVKNGKIDLYDFYMRRMKRILPVLYVVLAATLLTGLLVLTPHDVDRLFKSAVAALVSAANVFFYLSVDTGYFAEDSKVFPLLHLWSLGVEEQFYLIWPLIVVFLVVVVRTYWVRIFMLSAILLSSLFLAQQTVMSDHAFAYYMLPTRAWELLAGALAAFLVYFGWKMRPLSAQVLSVLGMIAIIFSLVMLDEEDPVPGLVAFPAIFGVASVILSGSSNHKTLVCRILSSRYLVGIGLVSYSAYLWHWPILAYLRYAFFQIDLATGAAVLFLTLFLSLITYKYVEVPFRRNRLDFWSVFVRYFIAPSFMLSAVSMVVIYAVSTKADYIADWERYDSIKQSVRGAYSYKYNCQFSNFDVNAYTDDRCVFPEYVVNPDLFLIGDSNAAHYLGMLRVFAKEYGFSLRNASQSSCPLVFAANIDYVRDKYMEGCEKFRTSVRQEISKYDTIAIGLSWNSHASRGGEKFLRDFEETLMEILAQGKKVILLSKIPLMPGYDSACEIRSLRMKWLDCKNRFDNTLDAEAVNRWLLELSERFDNVEYFDIRSQLCQNNICSPYVDDVPVYFNYSHLSMEGSELIGTKLVATGSEWLSVFSRLGGREQVFKPHLVIEEHEDYVDFRLVPEMKDVQVAFYLYKDGERVSVQRYGESRVFRLNKASFGAGSYRVKFFVVSADSIRPTKDKKLATGYSPEFIMK